MMPRTDLPGDGLAKIMAPTKESERCDMVFRLTREVG